MMNKNILCTVVLAGSLVIAQPALADSWCKDGLTKMVHSLKMDDAQKAKITPILEELKSSMKENETKMMALDTQMKEQTGTATVDQSKIDDLIDEKAAVIGSMMKAKMKAQNQIAEVLTAPQKTDFQNMVKKSEEKMAAKFKNCHDED